MQIPEYALIKKIEAIACFKSQVSIRPYLSEEMILATARYWGRYNNYQAAEPLEIIRQRVSMTEKSE